MKKGFKAIIVVFIILIIFGGLGITAYYRYKDKLALIGKRTPEELDLATPVAVYKAQTGSISESLILNGEIFPLTEVNIYSTVPGKIKEILVKDGDNVQKGDVLAYIDRSEAGLIFVPTPVETTIDGVVKKIMIEYGDYITPQLPLFQIIDISAVEVVVHIPEKDISKIKPGIRSVITVVAYPERDFYGRVSKVSPVLDPLSRTLEACILINNKNRILKPGMFGEVKIVLRNEPDALMIPLAAVLEREGRRVVFIEENGLAVEIEPVLDIKEEDKISVKEGLAPGQNIIVIGQQNVSNGDKVIVTEEVE